MNDQEILRPLAEAVMNVANEPGRREVRELWIQLNGLRPARPMVILDQICWNELEGPELELHCASPEARDYEVMLRRILYRRRHFPADMIVAPYIPVRMAVTNTGFGIITQDEIAVGDPTNSVVGHKYRNQFAEDSDLEKIKMPVVTHDRAETARRLEFAHSLFGDSAPLKLQGEDPQYVSFWDPISFWMSVEEALFALIDRPDFIHAMLDRMTRGYLAALDQLEAQNLLCGPQDSVHCAGALTDELPAPGADPNHPRATDLWCMGLAQMLSTVSPEMFDEFEVPYMSRVAERFGMVYYGCCDPLDGKMEQVRKIPRVRKISMSPWADQERGAGEIRGQFVFSRKPNPAFLAGEKFHESQVRADLVRTRDLCRANGCPLEFILKDISTVRYRPERLDRWAQIAMEVAQE